VSGLLELGFPIAVKLFVDQLLPTGNWPIIVAATTGLLVIYVANTALMAIVTYWGHMLGINIETDMRRQAFEHVQRLSFRFFDNAKTGHIIGWLTKDLEEIGEVAHHGPEDLFIAIMTFVGALAIMASIHPQLALLTVVIVPTTAWVTSTFGRRMSENVRRMFARVGSFNVRIEEAVGGIRVVQAFANEGHEARLFERDNQNYRSTKLGAYKLMAASASLNYMSMRAVQMIVMIAGSYYVLHGNLSSGGFVSFLLLVGVFFRPVEKINSVIETYPKGIAGFRRFLDLLATEPDVRDAADAIPVERLEGDIRFDHMSFGYAADAPVLDAIDLHVPKGMTLAVVGPSGSGKTTLCSLLPRFYDVTRGRITIDGIDIRSMTLASLRSQIGIVQQDVYLFGGTMRENIGYGRLGATDADILAAASRARLNDVIASLPDGLDTILGERGVKLSGGQRQRVAIARMFLKDPPILILDEATSALDAGTERAIQQSLAELTEGRTTIVIAHRLATIRNADLIAVIDGGAITELGPHGRLVAGQGTYARLYQTQFAI
jgi:ATP-binding cassette subfamily B protein